MDRAEGDVGARGFVGREDPRQPVGRRGLVIVEEGDQGGVGGAQGGVARRSHAGRGDVDIDQPPGAVGAQGLDPVAGGALGVVIGDDDLAQPVGDTHLPEQGAQGALQTVGAAQGGDDDGDVGGHDSTSPTVRMAAPRACAWATMRSSAAGVQPYFEGFSRTSWV